jgi:HSP20 family protein
MVSKYSSDILIEIQGMKNRVDKIMEKTFEHFSYKNSSPSGTWQPITDVYETEKHYVIQMELPGVEKEDINIELKDNQLIIYGEKKLIKETTGCSYLVLERSYGPFVRGFSLPQDIDDQGISASLSTGILMVRIPKKNIEPEEIKIQIQVED